MWKTATQKSWRFSEFGYLLAERKKDDLIFDSIQTTPTKKKVWSTICQAKYFSFINLIISLQVSLFWGPDQKWVIFFNDHVPDLFFSYLLVLVVNILSRLCLRWYSSRHPNAKRHWSTDPFKIDHIILVRLLNIGEKRDAFWRNLVAVGPLLSIVTDIK